MPWLPLVHPGLQAGPDNIWEAWTIEPALWINLGGLTLVYLWAVRNVWRRAGVGHGISVRRCLTFVGAIVALAIALLSPLDTLSGVLFSAHMAQHLVLTLVAAPLLVLSDYPRVLLWALPRHRARALARRLGQAQPFTRAWQLLSNPVSAWLLFAMVLWVWHAPALYEAALRDNTIHALEHLSFMLAAMLYWWVLLQHSRPSYLHHGMAIPYLFATALQSGILGALMTFSSQPWYSYYAPFVARWGLTPLEDQQLAGLLMWLPAGAVFSLLTIGYFAAWFSALEQRSLRLQPRDDRRHSQ